VGYETVVFSVSEDAQSMGVGKIELERGPLVEKEDSVDWILAAGGVLGGVMLLLTVVLVLRRKGTDE
ncbi:MAG: hypothetical protein KAW09_11320, partial [Thermoplasmata archaeon]|nr:hypothetical protein [Thermoplasmata archaeon]